MREASYQDGKGRYWAVLLPEGVPDSDANMGLPLGPPDISELDLPEEAAVRLHNELFARRIFTYSEATKRRQDIFSALQAAFKLDTSRVVDVYYTEVQIEDATPINGNEPKSSRRKVNG